MNVDQLVELNISKLIHQMPKIASLFLICEKKIPTIHQKKTEESFRYRKSSNFDITDNGMIVIATFHHGPEFRTRNMISVADNLNVCFAF